MALLDRNLYSVYLKMIFIDKILFLIIHLVDRVYAWHKLPVFLGLVYLEIRRTLHQRYNLLNVGATPVGVRKDPFNMDAGSEGTFFGRNMLPSPQKNELLRPDPMVVATKLLARRKMIDTGEQFNMLAASWIQFMVHDWIDHVEDTKQDHYHGLDDEELYRSARLVTSAIIAKIHTIDWTVELLKTNTLLAAMRANWYGLFGKRLKDMFGHTGCSLLSGFIGMAKPQNHGVPYSLTEEFVSVYRMHSLMPDNLLVRDIRGTPTRNKTPRLQEEVDLRKLIGIHGERTLQEIGNEAMIVSMGHQASGALNLWNYPIWMRDLIVQDPNGRERADPIDLAALEIYRDRERSVSRYNEFRRNMLMIPITKWEDLTEDKEAIQVLREVYDNDVENLDLLVGLMAEKKIKGYAISETAFFIFVLMASRRLEADRFFTSDFNEKVYTKEGLARVNSTESLKDVLNRHYPEMVEKWVNSSSAFSVWSASPEPINHIPLYLRIPQ